MQLYFYLIPILLLFSVVPYSWAQEPETKISDTSIEFIIDIVHDFDQTFSFNASFNSGSNSELNVQPITNVLLIDPDGSIISESSSDKISILHTPEFEGQYIIKINILDDQDIDYDWPSIFLHPTIEIDQNLKSFGGLMIGSKNVMVMDYSVVEPGNPAKAVTKIIYPSGWYKFEDTGKMKGSTLISIAQIPIVALIEEHERNLSRELEMNSIQFDGKYVDIMTDDELIERLQEIMATELETPVDALTDETVAEEFMKTLNSQLLETTKIIETLKERGYEFEAQVLSEDGLLPSFVISDPTAPNDEILVDSHNILSESSNEITHETEKEIQSLPTDIKSPKYQTNEGIDPDDVICKANLELIFKTSDGTPSCVQSLTAEKLIQRGWAMS